MSAASDYVARVATVKTSLDSAMNTAPAPLARDGFTACVTAEGYCQLGKLSAVRRSQDVLLPAADALALGQWLVTTFGDK